MRKHRHPDLLCAASMPSMQIPVSARVLGGCSFGAAEPVASATDPKRKMPVTSVTNPKRNMPMPMEKVPAWECRLVERIHRLLQKLDKDRRRAALSSKFSQRQRLVLEVWMKTLRTATCSQSHSDGKSNACGGAAACRQVSSKELQQSTATWVNTIQKKPAKRKHAECSATPTCTGVATHRNQTRGVATYSAVMSIMALEVRSRQVSDKEVATRLRHALLEVKEVLTAELVTTPIEKADSRISALANRLHALLPSTVARVLREHQLDEAEMEGMYMRATLTRTWFGLSLCGPAFHFGQEFETGISGWQRLRLAEESGADVAWSAVRAAYLDMWGAVGRSTEPLAAKLDTSERRSACQEKRRRNILMASYFAQRKQELKKQHQERVARAAERRAAKHEASANKTEATLGKLLAHWDTHLRRRRRSFKAEPRLDGFA